jgi:hypothetical protein
MREFYSENLQPPLERPNLEEFALFVFESLRYRSDIMTAFEIGYRLDTGLADPIGSEHGKMFFVNEITRWYAATYFSTAICAEPKTHICRAFGKRFHSLLETGMEDIF